MTHHTWTDWDWSDENWELNTGMYVSAPSSLRFTGAAMTLNLCNLVDSRCLPQGKLVTFFNAYDDIYGIIHFRNQKAVPDVDFVNCYYVLLEENRIRLYRRVNSADSNLGDWTPLNTRNQWRKWTVTWWLFKEPYEDVDCRIRIRGDVAGVDPLFEETVDDPNNQWAESEVNRCGLAGVNPTWPQNFDDTEIWLPSA